MLAQLIPDLSPKMGYTKTDILLLLITDLPVRSIATWAWVNACAVTPPSVTAPSSSLGEAKSGPTGMTLASATSNCHLHQVRCVGAGLHQHSDVCPPSAHSGPPFLGESSLEMH